MPEKQKANPDLVNSISFSEIRSTKVADAFQRLLVIGEKIENLTLQLKEEIGQQKNKTEPEFLQKLKPKIFKLAKLHQEEFECLEIIKRNETENSPDTQFSTLLTVPLFVLEEKIWKNFGLPNPWAELKLKSETLLKLAIENEIEHANIPETQLKQQIESWKNGLSLFGVSVQYKTNSDLTEQEFEELLSSFAVENQTTEAELELSPAQAELQKTLSNKINSIEATIKSNDKDDLKDYPVKDKLYKKSLSDIDLSSIDKEIDELLNTPKQNTQQAKFAANYLKQLLNDTTNINGINEDRKTELKAVENFDDKQQRLLTLDKEIEDYLKKMNIVIKGSVDCDNRLLEYLRVRIKSIANLLIEKDFLLCYGMPKNKNKLDDYINENLRDNMKVLVNELLDTIKEVLILNIDKENQEIINHNKKNKTKKPLRILNEDNWNTFSKKLRAEL